MWIARGPGEGGGSGDDPREDPLRAARHADDHDDDHLLCVVCEHPITREVHRIAVDDHHEHTFVNPAGFDYRIGCFGVAAGCIHLGDPDRFFTWFPGYSWQIAACGSCRTHVGWLYRRAGDSFHGLILDRLRPRSRGDRPVAPS